MKTRKNVAYEYKQLSTKVLKIDDAYQRELDQKRVARIAKDYDPCMVNAVKVSYRDGKYYVYDGMHTMAVEKTVRGNGKDVLVDCKVYSGLTRFDEMELFVSQNGKDARPVLYANKLRALYNFGDKDVVNMVRDAEAVGIKVDFTKSAGVNKIIAHSALMHDYLWFCSEEKRPMYGEMLSTIRDAWAGAPESFSAQILNGMTLFYLTYNGEFKQKDLVKSLKRVNPVLVVREGKSLVGSSGAKSYARVILGVYNNNRSTHRLEDKL